MPCHSVERISMEIHVSLSLPQWTWQVCCWQYRVESPVLWSYFIEVIHGVTTLNRNKHRDVIDWLSSVLRPLQHSIGYMGDGFYRSKDPTNSIKVLKERRINLPFVVRRRHNWMCDFSLKITTNIILVEVSKNSAWHAHIVTWVLKHTMKQR